MTGDDDDEEVVTPRSREEWALLVALQIQKDHGEFGPLYIPEMLGKSAIEGNTKAIASFREIAKAYEAPLTPKTAKH